MKKCIFLMTVFVLFLPSFLFGFAFRYAESSKIKQSKQNEFVKLDEFLEDYTHEEKNDKKDYLDSNKADDSTEEKADENLIALVDDRTLSSIEKAMDDPKVIDTLASVAKDLDDIQLILEDEDEKEMIVLIQESLQGYMSEKDSYKETVSEAVLIYNKLNTNQKNHIINTIMSNVSWREMLFLKRAFGF